MKAQKQIGTKEDDAIRAALIEGLDRSTSAAIAPTWLPAGTVPAGSGKRSTYTAPATHTHAEGFPHLGSFEKLPPMVFRLPPFEDTKTDTSKGT